MKLSLNPWLGVAMLAGAAMTAYPGRNYVLIAVMLLWPLLDRSWQTPALPRTAPHRLSWVVLALAGSALLFWQPSQVGFALTTLTTAALPEEWFFRAYFMTSQGKGLRTNLIASAIFSLLHGFTVDWTTALLVFIPSLFYGWLYQRTRDLPLLVLVHGLSNLVFVLFIAERLATWTGYLR